MFNWYHLNILDKDEAIYRRAQENEVSHVALVPLAW